MAGGLITPQVAGSVGGVILKEYRRQLAITKKVATRRTLESLESRVLGTVKGQVVEIWGGSGWRHIEVGKRANTKMPVKKTNDGWVLLEPLKEWHETVAPQIPRFLLARKIARDARAGVPLADSALERAWPKVGEVLLAGFSRQMLKNF